MKNKTKRILSILSIITILLSMNLTAFAYGEAYNFTVKKGSAVQKSKAVAKVDSERKSYVTVNNAMWSTKDPWIFGARVRTSSDTVLTAYYTTRRIGAMGNPGLPFVSGAPAYAGLSCRLNAQADSSSGATIITVNGVWLPYFTKLITQDMSLENR